MTVIGNAVKERTCSLSHSNVTDVLQPADVEKVWLNYEGKGKGRETGRRDLVQIYLILFYYEKPCDNCQLHLELEH